MTTYSKLVGAADDPSYYHERLSRMRRRKGLDPWTSREELAQLKAQERIGGVREETELVDAEDDVDVEKMFG